MLHSGVDYQESPYLSQVKVAMPVFPCCLVCAKLAQLQQLLCQCAAPLTKKVVAIEPILSHLLHFKKLHLQLYMIQDRSQPCYTSVSREYKWEKA